MRPLVLDTNIVLDLLVFQDTATEPLHQALDWIATTKRDASAPTAVCLSASSLHWIATTAMRDELARVLGYPHIVKRLQRAAANQPCEATDLATRVLAHFETQVHFVAAAPKASVTCRDPDDQKFIDLAVAHQALLLSKDKAVLCMKKRLLALGVHALAAIDFDIISRQDHASC
jgi:predicted nucleic acid-binding protein